MDSSDILQAEIRKLKQEVTSHKIELHQARGYLQCILQNSADMIFAMEVGGMLISFSKGGEKVLGYSLFELVGSQVKDLAIDPALFEQLLNTSQEDGSSRQSNLPFRHKNGNTVFCHVSLINLTNREGLRVGTVGVCRDITLWKKLQDDLVRIDRLAEIGRIAAGVAHEINNPLAVISEASGWAGMVVRDAKGLRPEDRVELTRATEEIGNQTKRCRSITHQLLGFARDSDLMKTEFDVHEVLTETISFLRPEVKHSAIEINTRFMPGSLRLNSDPKLLGQVFVNFITNAIHAVREKHGDQGYIEIRTSKTDSEIEICFEDNGTGIAAADQDKIFELFYSTKPPGKGTGLGLPICQNIINKLNGKITLQSEEGVGTTFFIHIPIF